jgi:hypothetical protein
MRSGLASDDRVHAPALNTPAKQTFSAAHFGSHAHTAGRAEDGNEQQRRQAEAERRRVLPRRVQLSLLIVLFHHLEL